MLLFAAAVLMTGLELARAWQTHWPRATAVQFISAVAVLAMTGVLTLIDPAHWWPIRLGQLVLLLAVFGLAIIASSRRSDDEFPVWAAQRSSSRSSGGRHRK
jgi:hypothetical protein